MFTPIRLVWTPMPDYAPTPPKKRKNSILQEKVEATLDAEILLVLLCSLSRCSVSSVIVNQNGESEKSLWCILGALVSRGVG
ncbi:hypothetical protein E2C01_072719 [Portunus trituberculatus]|uniref:Uncharacterized protein n=1 Tax=Portunus trituberculatus TaxID=210409 RepID=A0A5B7I7X2_PORTR|nr:hypothetical protein [Portunus trituberculatus]